jgi:predicted glutamine amidotransferase
VARRAVWFSGFTYEHGAGFGIAAAEPTDGRVFRGPRNATGDAADFLSDLHIKYN